MTTKPYNTPLEPTPEDIDRVIRYAEGDLTPDERAAFEAEMADHPELAAMLERMESIDESLRTHFGAPSDTTIAGSIRPSVSMPRRIIGIAALIAIVGALSFVYLHSPTPTVQLAHARGVLEGPFQPFVVCDTYDKFRQYGIDTFDVPLAANFDAAATANITLVGWRSYQGRYGDESISGDKPVRVLLALGPNDERVIVVFRAKDTLRFETKDTLGYTKHSTTIGGLVVDEISTLPEPIVLPLLGVEG